MIAEIKIPAVGESITEGVLMEWLREDGAQVAMDDPLFELETDKITLNVTAEHAGRLAILVAAESTVTVGQVVGTIDTAVVSEVSSRTPTAQDAAAVQAAPAAPQAGSKAGAPLAEVITAVEDLTKDDLDGLSPSVRRLVAEHRLSPGDIDGSGKDGRVTKGDVLRHLEARATAPQQAPSAGPAGAETPPAPPAAETAPPAPPEGDRRETRRPMSSLRRRLAQRLVEVQQTAAILTTFNEVDMSAVMALRARYKEAFEQRHGVRLGFMSFFVKAAVEALRSVPAVNSRIEGDQIVQAHYHDIGVAVGTDKGLVVPVVRDAGRLSFAQVERAIGELADKARLRRLTLDDLAGGTFTISNGGVYGSLLSTPIINPPQSAILGMHGIKKRPVALGDDDHLEVRPMMYLALSYDHRLIDGAEAVTFLRRVVECIESPERLLLEV